MNNQTKHSLKIALTFLLMGLIIGGSIVYVVYASPLSTFYLSEGIYPHATSYTISRESSTYYSKNAYGQIPTWGTSTNASELILTSVNALSQGGTIYFKNGVYELDTEIWVRNINNGSINLVGESASHYDSPNSGVLLKAISPMTQVIRFGDSDTPYFTRHSRLENLGIDGNGQATYCVRVDHVTASELISVMVWNATQDGFYVYSGSQPNSGIIFEDCRSFYNGRHGFNVAKGEYMTFVRCTSGGNQEHGWSVTNIGGAGIYLISPISMNDGLNRSGNEKGIIFAPTKGGAIFGAVVVGDEGTFPPQNPNVGIQLYADASSRNVTVAVYQCYVTYAITGLRLGEGGTENHLLRVDGAHLSFCSTGVKVPSGNNETIVISNLLYNNVTTPSDIGTPNLVQIQSYFGGWLSNHGNQTGTGGEQTIPHGLAGTPTLVLLSPPTTQAYESSSADSTNIYITADNGENYYWYVEYKP